MIGSPITRSTTVLSALLGASLTWLAVSPASAERVFPTMGGGGGAENHERCPNGRYLIGVRIKFGSWVDQIAIICAEVHNDERHRNEWVSKQTRGGRGGGGPIDRKCSPGERIETLGVVPTASGARLVRSMDFGCVPLSGKGGRLLAAGPSTGLFPNVYQKCPAGQAATGLHVRSGVFLDAVGLICDRFQPAGVQSPPPPPPATSSLGARIVAFAVARLNNRCVDRDLRTRDEPCPPLARGAVGHGECTDLVAGALTSVNARFNSGSYDWGREVGRRTAGQALNTLTDIQPGDIIQVFNARFVDPSNPGNWSGTSSQHTAIIESNNGGVLSVLEQNTWDGDTNRRFVTRGTVNLNWTFASFDPNRGGDTRLIVYRAESRPQGFAAGKRRQPAQQTSGWRYVARDSRSPAGNWAAVAIDGKGRWGASIHSEGPKMAVPDALRRCGAGCRVVMQGPGRCVAVAQSTSGGYWVGHAYGNSMEVVRKIALGGCTKGAPRGTCRLVHVNCL